MEPVTAVVKHKAIVHFATYSGRNKELKGTLVRLEIKPDHAYGGFTILIPQCPFCLRDMSWSKIPTYRCPERHTINLTAPRDGTEEYHWR